MRGKIAGVTTGDRKMNAHANIAAHDAQTQTRMVARHIVQRQSTGTWVDLVGACDDCSTVPADAAAAGRRRNLVIEDDRLVMKDV
ncbi:hypothetical protein [Yoonia sp. 2307UL14-13]|uniref:hypothetical protein n=1 Tax=Yoonia sp. 2307UL14-13 TaxID=3126506 RepID=UPI0030B59DD4